MVAVGVSSCHIIYISVLTRWVICSLAESSLGGFTIVLAVGLEIVSLWKTWKPISNIAVP
jgi:hypothetical protein